MTYLYWIIASFLWFLLIYSIIPTSIQFIFNNNEIYDKNVKKLVEQRKFELKYSLCSIFIFSLGSIVLCFLEQQQRINFNFNNVNYLVIAFEFLILIIWNDIHFYIIHYLMHKSYLKKFHALHHRLKYPSVYSSYTLHPIEAILLGSVMPLILLFIKFHIISLLFLTIWSLTINSLEHNNKQYKFKSLSNHQLHHSHYHGNYSFFFSFLDKIFNTEIKK